MFYPIFLVCASLEKNTAWKKIYSNLSEGICPKNFSIDDSTITSRSEIYFYNDIEVHTLMRDIRELFKRVAGTYIQKRSYKKRGDLQWGNVRKGSSREILLIDYIKKFPYSERRKILATLKCGVLSGDINSRNIEMKEGKIHRIVPFDEESLELSESPPKKTWAKEKSGNLSEKWNLHLRNVVNNPLMLSKNSETL